MNEYKIYQGNRLGVIKKMKLGKAVVKSRVVILIAALVLLIPSVLGMIYTRVNIIPRTDGINNTNAAIRMTTRDFTTAFPSFIFLITPNLLS